MAIRIIEYQEQYTSQLIELILGIQVGEYGIATSLKAQPDLLKIPEFYQANHGNFWLALDDEKVVGTISLKIFSPTQGALRKMFVADGYRGKPYNIAQQLFERLHATAKEQQLTTIYLGTTDKYLAAHRFYEKNGFKLINKTQLPEEFPIVLVDNRFYCLDIA
ncbi:MAG: N-acetyltransferase [Neisseriaceae bacterium]|nr:MAG: N-acetyltransferase [Neisseriaceae bacterium]